MPSPQSRDAKSRSGSAGSWTTGEKSITPSKGAVVRIQALTSFRMSVFSGFQPVLVPTAALLWRGMIVEPITLMPRALILSTIVVMPAIRLAAVAPLRMSFVPINNTTSRTL